MKNCCEKLAVATALASLTLGAWTAGAQTPAEPAIHAEMGSMPGMDHSAIDHSRMDHSDMASGQGNGMDHGAMSTSAGRAPPDARDPHAYADGYDFGPLAPPHMGGGALLPSLRVDQLERRYSSDSAATAYDLQGWFGGSYDRAVLKAEGEIDDDQLKEARTELLWGHAVAPFWDTQLGIRHDAGEGPSRNWLGFGVQGLAPYWFELDVTAYIGESARSALRLNAEYELLITQHLILQPRVETNFYGQRDADRKRGKGLSDVAIGVRLRYEIYREFAPYVGVEHVRKFGDTADFARPTGEDERLTQLVAGLRFWF